MNERSNFSRRCTYFSRFSSGKIKQSRSCFTSVFTNLITQSTRFEFELYTCGYPREHIALGKITGCPKTRRKFVKRFSETGRNRCAWETWANVCRDRETAKNFNLAYRILVWRSGFVGCWSLDSITLASSNSGKRGSACIVLKSACSSGIRTHTRNIQFRLSSLHYAIENRGLYLSLFTACYPIMSLSDKPLLFVTELNSSIFSRNDDYHFLVRPRCNGVLTDEIYISCPQCCAFER